MIEIVPFNKNVFDSFSLEKNKLSNYIYINNLKLICKLLTVDLPIQNKRLALRNILDFLTFLDTQLSFRNDTILPISSEILISFFSRDKYRDYMILLKELNVITDVPYEDGKFYQIGKTYKLYRVHNEYLKEEDLAIVILEQDRSKEHFTNEVSNLDERYIKTIKQLDINIKDAIKSEVDYFTKHNLKVSTLRNRISRLFYTKRKRFIKTGSKVNRIYHSFTNVSKVSRNHLNINLINIDVTNCQPLLLASYLKINNIPFDIDYVKDCEAGIFYERFAGIDKLDRDEIKVQIYKTLFFAFKTNSNINKKFKQLYPLAWSALSSINDSKDSLASKLQNLESELFNNLIPEKSKHFFTLFDAIYFDNITDIKPLSDKIKNFFGKLDIEVKIKIGL